MREGTEGILTGTVFVLTSLLLLMNDAAAATKGGAGIGRVHLLRAGHLVVVNHRVALELVSDLDAEPIHGSAGRERGINGTEQKTIAPATVDGPGALEHGLHKFVASNRVFPLGTLALLLPTCGGIAPQSPGPERHVPQHDKEG
jgi:hypothetical protein